MPSTYYLANKAGSKFGSGMMPQHHITVRVLDGGKWSGDIAIDPAHVAEYTARKSVTKVKVKSDIVGWPKAEFKLPSSSGGFSPKVIIIERKESVGFDFMFVEDAGLR